MDMIWQATLDGYVKLLYDNDPQGPSKNDSVRLQRKTAEIRMWQGG